MLRAVLAQFLGHFAEASVDRGGEGPFSQRFREVRVHLAILEQPSCHREMAVPYSRAKSLTVRWRRLPEVGLHQLGDGYIPTDCRVVKECITVRPFGGRDGGICRDKSRHHLTLTQHRCAKTVDARSL